ncbi:MAG: hypothetical protein ABWZ42_10305 [Ilumatobacteraceae bacterium]
MKLPELLLTVICTPSTVIALFAAAVPSMRSLVPLTSARETLTAAITVSGVAAETTAISTRLATPASTAGRRDR